VNARRVGRIAIIGIVLGLGLVACRPNVFGDVSSSTSLAQNDSDAAAIVQFGGTPDDPDTSAYVVPAGVGGIIDFGREPDWKGRIAVVDERCKARWESRIESGGLIVSARDRTVSCSAGLEGAVGSAQASEVVRRELAEWPACSKP